MRKRLAALLLALIISFGFVGVPSNTAVAATKPAKQIILKNHLRLPYVSKFEFKKAAVRRTFNPSKDGVLNITLQKTRFTEKGKEGKVYVKVYFKNKKGKWVSPKGYYHTVKLTSKSQDFNFDLSVPKGNPFIIRIIKSVHKDVSVAGKLIIKD